MPGGAQNKLTPELQKKICDKIRVGCTRRYAAVSSGVSESAYYKWLAQGETGKRGAAVEFLQAVKKAEAEAVAAYELELRKLANAGNVTAVMFYLQNRAAETWKDKRVHEHSGPDRGPIAVRVIFEDEEVCSDAGTSEGRE